MSNANDTCTHTFLLCKATHTKRHEIQMYSKSQYDGGNMGLNWIFWKHDQTFTGLNKHINLMLTMNHFTH